MTENTMRDVWRAQGTEKRTAMPARLQHTSLHGGEKLDRHHMLTEISGILQEMYFRTH